MRTSRHVFARAIAASLALTPLLVAVPGRAVDAAPAVQAAASKALADMEALAARDDPTALVALAGLYYQGNGVGRDLVRAAALYQQAASLGDAEAQYRLGNLYLLGEGVARDDDWAFTWFRAAARQGHALARRNVDEFYRVAGLAPPTDLGDGAPTPVPESQSAPDSEQAQEKSAARHPQPVPDDPSEDELAALDALRAKGIAVDVAVGEPHPPRVNDVQPSSAADLPTARELLASGQPLAALPGLEQLAKAGNPEAQWMLAGVLAGVKRSDYDLTRSLQWLQKAAKGGWPDAQFALGGRYERGDGMSADEVEAVSWYRAAARQGHTEALERLRAIYRAAGVSMPPLDAPAAPSEPLPQAAPAKPRAGMDATDDLRRTPPVAHAVN